MRARSTACCMESGAGVCARQVLPISSSKAKAQRPAEKRAPNARRFAGGELGCALSKCTSTNDHCRNVLLADWGCRDVKKVDSRRDGSRQYGSRWTASGLERHRRRARFDRHPRSGELGGQLRILLDRTTESDVQRDSHSIHPRHGGGQKRWCGLGAIQGIVQTQCPFRITRSRAHGNVVSHGDHREEQD